MTFFVISQFHTKTRMFSNYPVWLTISSIIIFTRQSSFINSPAPPSFGLHEDNMLSYRYFSSESCDLDQVEHLCKPETVLLMEEILRSPVEVGSLSHYLQGFWHRMWCRIFVSISSSIPNNKALLTGFRNHWFPIEKGRLFWHRCLNWQKALRQGGRG